LFCVVVTGVVLHLMRLHAGPSRRLKLTSQQRGSECRRRRRLRSPFGMSAIIAALTGKGKVGRPAGGSERNSRGQRSLLRVRAGGRVRSASIPPLGSFAFAVGPLLAPHVFPIGASFAFDRLGGFPALCPRCSGKAGSGLAALLAGAPLDARPAPGHRTPRLTPPASLDHLAVVAWHGSDDVNSSSSHTLTHAIKSLVLGFVLEFTHAAMRASLVIGTDEVIISALIW